RNIGVGSSREKGVNVAKGNYIIHCDSDDWIEPTMYEEMYNLGLKNNADIIGCDFIDEYPGCSEYRKQNFALKGKEICKGILEGTFHSGLWSRMVKREYIKSQNAHFIPNLNFMEDTLYVFSLHLNTNKTEYLPKGLYHYRQVNGGLTHCLNKKQLEHSLFVVKIIGSKIKGDDFLSQSYQRAIAYHAQGLITRLDSYDPNRWRNMTFKIPLSYFGSFYHRISPFLVRMHFDRINKFLIRIIRSRCLDRIRRNESF
ncbi:MAG: glycosyltransferase, partial [Muribaculaceae bacterium]|nr:glycosyltransferase [Muribaculaceae bacterium]